MLLAKASPFLSRTLGKTFIRFSHSTTRIKAYNQIKYCSPLSLPLFRSRMIYTECGSNPRPASPANDLIEPLLPYSVSNNSSTITLGTKKYSTNTSTTTEELERWSWKWWKEWTIIFIVFGITGSTTVRIVRPVVTNVLGIDGGFIDGPWTYRISYLCITIPLYSIILLIVGTLFGRHAYFKKIVLRMYGRFIPSRLIKRIRGNRNDGCSQAAPSMRFASDRDVAQSFR
ncbi:21160_t:CDS:2 [Cetraspora pellucida]|uniref:21160_t:CDS:1 n=1 Tax=Cetraspora pellucida TaxID=1433469 RepID=A0A9N9GYM2_9GLOM|nr:21160_t:CDS:2 [Cetraspora pellucida]